MPNTTTIEKIHTEANFLRVPYLSNYYNCMELLKQEEDISNVKYTELHKALKEQNESFLRRYYQSRRLTSSQFPRRGSVTSNRSLDGYTSQEVIEMMALNRKVPVNNNIIYDSKKTNIKADMIPLSATKPFTTYYKRLSSANIAEWDIINNHILWLPSYNELLRYLLLYNKRNDKYTVGNKSSALFIDGEYCIPKAYDFFHGSTTIPSLFGQVKLPALTYHSCVTLDDQMFIWGGLFPTYRYDEEYPSLDDFIVDGVPNLPPPLLPELVNHPAFLANPLMYVVNVSTSSVTTPVLTGDVPPRMLCVTASKLTDRYILYFGGLDLKSQSQYDEKTKKTYIKRRAYPSNAAYILDTLNFHFTRIDFIPKTKEGETLAQIFPRFGHIQVCIDGRKHGSKNKKCNRWYPPTLGSKASSLTTDSNHDFSNDSELTLSTKRTNTSTVDSIENKPFTYSNTIYIFGGYKQCGTEDFEALNDFWKIQIPILSKGKNGFCSFNDTAMATCLSQTGANGHSITPSERGFPAFCTRYDVTGLNYLNFEVDLLQNLKENFEVALSEDFLKKTLHLNLDKSELEKVISQSKEADDLISKVPNAAFCDKFGPKIILHGGSNRKNVYGDMWWFNIETETWSQVDTYTKTETSAGDDTLAEVPGSMQLNLRKVGHNMKCIGNMISMCGGMLQSDVDEIYGCNDVESYLRRKAIGGVELGSHMFCTFDLRTQFFIYRTAMFSKNDTHLDYPLASMDTSLNNNLMLVVGSTLSNVAGRYVLVGGVTSVRSKLRNFLLRGAILNITIPAMSVSS